MAEQKILQDWEARYLGRKVDWDSLVPEIRDSKPLVELLMEELAEGIRSGHEALERSPSWEKILETKGKMRAIREIMFSMQELLKGVQEHG